MKRLGLFLFIFSLVVFTACNKGIAKGTLACVKSRIKSFDKSNSCSSAHVDEFTFQGATVYAFDPGTCGADMTTEVISSSCTDLGSLGGFAGNTKINGEEFSNATFVKTVWKK